MLQSSIMKLFMFALYFCGSSFGEIFEECGQKEGVYISSNQGCPYYIFCYGEDSFMERCEEDTPYFSESDQTCATDPGVCVGGEANSTNNTTLSSAIEIETSPTTLKEFESTAQSLNATQSSTAATTTMISTSGLNSNSTSVSTVTSLLASQCPTADDHHKIVFIADRKSCASYFMCYHGEPLAMQCSNKLHFDPKSQKCDYPETVKCQLGSASSAHEKCQGHVFDVFAHASNCNYYYLCRFGYLMVMQCPFNMGWDYEKRSCVRRHEAKCYNSFKKLYKRL